MTSNAPSSSQPSSASRSKGSLQPPATVSAFEAGGKAPAKPRRKRRAASAAGGDDADNTNEETAS